MTVNMDKDYEDLYANLDSLLKDICKFLETKSLHLSPADKCKADVLIERSKKHLQIIEKFSTANENNGFKQLQEIVDTSNENERYVDMTKKPVLPQKLSTAESTLYESKCPFQDLPAKEASQEIKYGPLTKRRKVLNIIDVSTKIYAVIHENWLLLYNSSKDLKPDCALDLKQYEAKEDESDPNLSQEEISKETSLKKNTLNLKMTSSFKVFDSLTSQKKCYSFAATTHKDMLQWVVNINRRHDKAVLTNKQIDEEQNYEICQDLQVEEEEENIYNEIEMPCRSTQSRPISLKTMEENDPPAIPEKRPTIPKYVPHPPLLSSSTESMVSYEELEKKTPLQNDSEKCSLNSFESSDEEDQTYYELDTIIKDKAYKKQLMQENNIDFNVPSTLPILKKTNEIVSDDEDIAYENGLTVQTNPSPNNKNDLKSTVNELKTSENKRATPSESKTIAKPSSPEKTSPIPLTPKPKIISPKPWKPFKKNILSKNPQIYKSKSIRESLKSPLNLEKQLSSEESPSKDISPVKENYCTSKTDGPQVSSDISSFKPNQGSIVQIIRSKWSTNQSPSCSLETFSRNSKIETFQASPTKETLSTDFLRSPTADLNVSLRPVDTLHADLAKNRKNEDKKPMVLLKSSLEEEESSKKLKKSPVVPVKPRKVAKILALKT